jgi:TolA-binding protein
MKKLLTILLAAITMAVSACQHEEIWNELRDHEQRIEQLEKQCRELNSNVEAIQAILAAIQENDYVTEIMKIMEDGVEVGYSITFAKGGTVTIYHGTDGAAGATPDIGIKKASDGAYTGLQTANGSPMTRVT